MEIKPRIKITEVFGLPLAKLLAQKIQSVYPDFDAIGYQRAVEAELEGKSYTQRIELHATKLKQFLPANYLAALEILMRILGPENPNQTGMFTEYWWLMPVGKFIEKYGLDHFEVSMNALGEVTKRNTGEYAVRPFICKYPEKSLQIMTTWAKSPNFHLRRLSSEGLRPKLPWAPKLDTFIHNPKPVLDILELLKEDDVKFVQKSVANHLRDWLKVNPLAVESLIKRWGQSQNPHTQWILKHAQR